MIGAPENRTRASDGPLFEIVGVAANRKVLTLAEGPTPFLHVARSQRSGSYAAILARTRGDASALLRDRGRELLGWTQQTVNRSAGTTKTRKHEGEDPRAFCTSA